ncbi:MAG: shikimate dehydrogenase [Cellulosilyticaceae bacterium]
MLQSITGKHRVCGVIGDPISHTLSPLIHNTINKYGEEQMVYVPFHVRPERLEEAIKGAYALGIQGLNVTMPHKQKIMSYLEEIDEEAKRVNAVNTIVYAETGYKGYNTDVYGLRRAMETGNIEYKEQNIAIIGSGGAAYAAVECVIQTAKHIHLFNRTLEKANELKSYFSQYYDTKITIHALNEEIEESIDLVIQTTGLGMGEHKTCIPECAPHLLAKAKYAVDMIYNPWETLFLKTAREKGCQCINGFGMLFYQAVRAYELMNRCEYSEAVIQTIEEEIYTLLK